MLRALYFNCNYYHDFSALYFTLWWNRHCWNWHIDSIV